ncbi:putative ribonuclease H-like domain-containing protein [Tanacetum coccineum]
MYGTIDEEVYVSQPPGFVDLKFPKKVYKVVKDLYGLHQAPRARYATLSTFLLKSRYRRGTIDKTLFIKKDKNDIMLVQVYVDDIIFGSTKRSWCDEFEALMKSRFQMSFMGELTFFLGLQVKQKEDGIFISQDKYVAEILKKFDFASVKTASTPIETHKPLVKDEEAADVDVHLYRYLKGKPKLGLWYPRESSFDLVAYSDSDYGGANLDRKSTTGGCQFLGHRLISWQCKKQTIVATSTTEAEYVAAANCCGQVLWIQNQMLDYGFNFMNTRIYIDNESTICIVKNPVFHSKTKHIEIRHHFIRDAYEKKLIQVLKIHTDDNVADLLTKAFDVSSLVTTAEDANLRKGNYWKHGCSLNVGFNSHTINGHQFTMSNRHQELASPEQTTSALAIPGQMATGKESSNPLMADSLPKTIQSNDPPLSRGYTLGSGEDILRQAQHGGIDFLTASHIHYALIENPTIYASFIKQFWTTATASTNVHREVKLTASIDGQAKIITEASLRRHLKLEDDGGITSLPNIEIFEQLALMGYATDSDKLTFQKVSTPSTLPPPILETTPTVKEPTPMPHESPLQSVHLLGRDEGSVSLNELMDLVTQLTTKVGSLENELMNTKKVYGSTITNLVNRVKKLEKQVKTSTARRGTKIVLSEDEAVAEDSSKQGRIPPHDIEIREKISDDTEVLLEEEETTELIEEPTELVEDQGSGEKGEQEVTTADTALNTASVPFSTTSATLEVSTAVESLVYIRRSAKKKKDKGKEIVIEDESVQKKSKKQVQEERLGYEEAIRLQEQIDEEERKGIARDAKIAKQLQEEYDKVGKKEVVTEVDIAHVID